jgi:hypothetical protein
MTGVPMLVDGRNWLQELSSIIVSTDEQGESNETLPTLDLRV